MHRNPNANLAVGVYPLIKVTIIWPGDLKNNESVDAEFQPLPDSKNNSNPFWYLTNRFLHSRCENDDN